MRLFGSEANKLAKSINYLMHPALADWERRCLQITAMVRIWVCNQLNRVYSGWQIMVWRSRLGKTLNNERAINF